MEEIDIKINNALSLIRQLAQGRVLSYGDYKIAMGEDGTIGFLVVINNEHKITGDFTFRDIVGIMDKIGVIIPV